MKFYLLMHISPHTNLYMLLLKWALLPLDLWLITISHNSVCVCVCLVLVGIRDRTQSLMHASQVLYHKATSLPSHNCFLNRCFKVVWDTQQNWVKSTEISYILPSPHSHGLLHHQNPKSKWYISYNQWTYTDTSLSILHILPIRVHCWHCQNPHYEF